MKRGLLCSGGLEIFGARPAIREKTRRGRLDGKVAAITGGRNRTARQQGYVARRKAFDQDRG